MTEKLSEYKKKRDFERTSEPLGGKGSSKEKIFVVQKHDASRLHYDFRLEMDGVLKSWAVPKGPSLNPKDKRLAVMTEDHPLDYAGFEGSIPKEEYGGGTVMVWDKGTYENKSSKDGERVAMKEALEKGHLSFELKGGKLKGEWALVRMRGKGGRNWLLVKADDKESSKKKDILKEDKSAKTARSLREIANP